MASAHQQLIFLGPPGAGKGTQADLLSERLQIPHISTGDILRDEVQGKQDLGIKAKKLMDKGELLPDDLMLDIVRERIGEKDCEKGFILDGFPRSVPQARGLDGMPGCQNLEVISLSVPMDDVVRRLSQRRTCRKCGTMFHLAFSPPKVEGICDRCGGALYQRGDDKEGVIQTRIKVYRSETEPLLAFYREKNVLREIDGTGSTQEVFERVVEDLGGAS